MLVEAIVWTGLVLVGPSVLRPVWSRWDARVDDRLRPALSLGRWFHSLGLPYLALITGAVAARDCGVSGRTAAEWLTGAAACAAGLGLAWVVLRLHPLGGAYPGPVQAATDEPRWALYRGTGSLLADPQWGGPLIGLMLGAVEWILTRRLWTLPAWSQAGVWIDFARLAGSTVLFLVTRNLWLLILTQAGLSMIVTRSSSTPVEVKP